MTHATASNRRTSLSFRSLRAANRGRVAQFKNKHGRPAHAKPDGSDWTPAAWLRALLGELGEYARVRHQYEAGELSYADYIVEAQKELADVQTYLDLLAMRALDVTESAQGGADPAQQLQQLIAGLGEYANWRKKLERGDITAEQFAGVSQPGLAEAEALLRQLRQGESALAARVTAAHPEGVALGDATVDKFNEVSRRVGAEVFIVDDQVTRTPPDELDA